MADNQDMTKVGVSHIELDAENIDAGRNISIIGLVLTVRITAASPKMLGLLSRPYRPQGQKSGKFDKVGNGWSQGCQYQSHD